MDDISRQINKLENRIARYIFLKYIQEPVAQSQTVSHQQQTEISNESESFSSCDKEDVHINSHVKTKIDKAAYNVFRKEIFQQKRSCFAITQAHIIKDDIYTMQIADRAYERNPRDFKVSNFDIPPDVLRCSFIRKHHHRYYRCRHTISNNDSDVCKKHENSENIYYDQYNDLLESLDSIQAKN